MNIPTHTSNVTKSINFLISISYQVSNNIFQLLHCNIVDEIELSLLANNQIHGRNARSNIQRSILRLFLSIDVFD